MLVGSTPPGGPSRESGLHVTQLLVTVALLDLGPHHSHLCLPCHIASFSVSNILALSLLRTIVRILGPSR